MSRPIRLAITLPEPGGVDATLARAEWAEKEGFDDLWLADTGGIDPLTLLPALGMHTKKIRIGIAVVPVFTRTPAVLASTAMTISHLVPGRFVLGIGSSSHAMIEGWHGLEFSKPLTRVRETALMLRSMMLGEKSSFEGDVLRSQGYRLSPAPQGEVPLYIGALRGKMLELAGELGDGAVVNLYPREHLPEMVAHIAAGAARAGVGSEAITRTQIRPASRIADFVIAIAFVTSSRPGKGSASRVSGATSRCAASRSSGPSTAGCRSWRRSSRD